MSGFKIIIIAIFHDNDFTNKALCNIHDKPMLQYVYESAKRSQAEDVVIATDSPRVGMLAEDFGATVCMIVDDSLKGISLLNAVVDKMAWESDTVIVTFPADAPLTPRSILQQVADNLIEHEDADCATLYSLISRDIAENTQTTKLVLDKDGYVLYCSHCLIPCQLSDQQPEMKYRCSIETNAYRASFLRNFASLSECELDQIENINELRLLYHGIKIHAEEANSLIGQRVFTKADIEKVEMQIAPSRL